MPRGRSTTTLLSTVVATTIAMTMAMSAPPVLAKRTKQEATSATTVVVKQD
jgi:hypothetical protein